MSSEERVPEIDAPIEKLGTLQFEHGDNVVSDCECDRLVHSGHTLMAASVVTSPGQVKAIRAMLHAKKGRVIIRPSGISTQYPSKRYDEYVNRATDPLLSSDQENGGYHLWIHKLEYNKVHATFITKSRKLLMYVSPEAVWSRLMDSEEYETPLIREWMPYVAKKLVEKKFLRECRCFRANAAYLEVGKVQNLDDIITDGLKNGDITIPATKSAILALSDKETNEAY